MTFLYIGIFGVLGVFARYGVGLGIEKWASPSFPFATLAANLLGSFAVGIVYVLGLERGFLTPELKVGIMVGFLGGFTTFSSYSLESVRLAEEGAYLSSALYFIGSPVIGGLMAFGGILLTRRFLGLL